MTAQDLIVAYCEHFIIRREELERLNSRRHEAMNEDFDSFFRDKEQTAASLRDFYIQSDTLPVGILHCAIGEMQSYQVLWVQRTIRDMGAKTALDYGCGLSPAVGPLAETIDVTLADIPGKQFPLLAKIYPKARLVKLGEPEENFSAYDVVVCQEVFEHTDEPLETAKKVLSFVAEGGTALLSWCFDGSGGNHTHLAKHEAYQGYAGNLKFENELRDMGWKTCGGKDKFLQIWRRD